MKDSHKPRETTVDKYFPLTLELCYKLCGDFTHFKADNWSGENGISKAYIPKLRQLGLIEMKGGRGRAKAKYRWVGSDPTRRDVSNWLSEINKDQSEGIRQRRAKQNPTKEVRSVDATIINAVAFIREIRSLCINGVVFSGIALTREMKVNAAYPSSLKRLGYIKKVSDSAPDNHLKWINNERKSDHEIAVEMIESVRSFYGRRKNKPKKTNTISKPVETQTQSKPKQIKVTSDPIKDKAYRKLKLFGVTIFEWESAN